MSVDAMSSPPTSPPESVPPFERQEESLFTQRLIEHAAQKLGVATPIRTGGTLLHSQLHAPQDSVEKHNVLDNYLRTVSASTSGSDGLHSPSPHRSLAPMQHLPATTELSASDDVSPTVGHLLRDLKVYEKALGLSHPQTVRTHIQIADILSSAPDGESQHNRQRVRPIENGFSRVEDEVLYSSSLNGAKLAESHYFKALHALEISSGKHSAAVASVVAKLGALYMDSKLFSPANAKAMFDRASAIAALVGDATDAKVDHEVVCGDNLNVDELDSLGKVLQDFRRQRMVESVADEYSAKQRISHALVSSIVGPPRSTNASFTPVCASTSECCVQTDEDVSPLADLSESAPFSGEDELSAYVRARKLKSTYGSSEVEFQKEERPALKSAKDLQRMVAYAETAHVASKRGTDNLRSTVDFVTPRKASITPLSLKTSSATKAVEVLRATIQSVKSR